MKQPYEDATGFSQRPAELISGRLFDFSDYVAKGVREFVDVGNAAVEAHFIDILGDVRQRAVGCLAYRYGLFAEARRPRRRCINLGNVTNKTPQALHKSPGALHTFLGPDYVAVGRRIGKHEPARSVCAVGRNDVIGIHRVLLRF